MSQPTLDVIEAAYFISNSPLLQLQKHVFQTLKYYNLYTNAYSYFKIKTW